MRGIKSHDYSWSKSWIEFRVPNAQGVYSIQDKAGKVIFVGKGNVRERLLKHWDRKNSIDASLWNYNPATFRFELTDRPAEREAELVHDLKPPCNQAARSRFPKFW